jgi:TetR/AcrR family transcriptional regulator, mexCD-oprJ operon repressor
MNGTASSDQRLRTPAAILRAAARLLADDGDPSMADLAAAAGVGRATLYRYYPNREAVLAALTAEALDELAARLADAGLETSDVEEAIGRIVRAVLTVGDRYAVLVRERFKADPDDIERAFTEPIRHVLQRGVDDGLLRDDVPVDVHLTLFGGTLQAGVRLAGDRRLGHEDAAAAVTRAYLDGARRR